MKIQAGLFLDKAKKMADVINTRMEGAKKSPNKDNSKKIIVEISKKLYDIRKNQSDLQSEISKKQYISNGINNIISYINDNKNNLNMDSIKKGIATIIANASYEDKNILNDYIMSNAKIDNIETNESLEEFSLSLDKHVNKLNYEINSLSLEVDRLNVSENNILSLNIVNQRNLSKIIKDLTHDRSNKENIYSLIKHNDISKFFN